MPKHFYTQSPGSLVKFILWLRAIVFHGGIVASHYVHRQTNGRLQASLQRRLLHVKQAAGKVQTAVLLFVFATIVTSNTIAQDSLQTVAKPLTDVTGGVAKEKMFVHTDKDVYLAGEILWFKIYNTQAGTHKPFSMSKVAYVELLDSANKPVVQAKIALNNASGSGSFYLPVAMASAVYTLRAYTNWMKNFEAADYYYKDVTIYNVQKLPPAQKQQMTAAGSVGFASVGSNLVNDVSSRDAPMLQMSLSSDQAVYETRSKITLTLNADNFLNPGDTANLSLAVYRLDSLQQSTAGSIEAYLLTPAPDASLTAAKPLFTFAPEYNGHIITGNVVSTLTGKGEANIQTYVSAPATRTLFSTSISDGNGNIGFELHGLYGTSRIIAQTNNRRDSTYRITINDPFSHQFVNRTKAVFLQPEKFPATLLQHSIGMQVQNIYSAPQTNRFEFPDVDTSAFYLQPDATYLLDNYTRFTTLEEVLREYIALVNVTKRNGRYHFPVFDLSSAKMLEGEPLVLLDGMPEFDFNRFIAYDPLKVKKMEVVNRKYFLGSDGFDGILNCQTYTGDLPGYDIDPRAVVLDYEGLQLARSFYAPVYNTAEEKSSHLPDFRNVLYWNPDITLKGVNLANLSFYTSDMPGKYAVVLQGISASGLPGSKVITFDVRR